MISVPAKLASCGFLPGCRCSRCAPPASSSSSTHRRLHLPLRRHRRNLHPPPPPPPRRRRPPLRGRPGLPGFLRLLPLSLRGRRRRGGAGREMAAAERRTAEVMAPWAYLAASFSSFEREREWLCVGWIYGGVGSELWRWDLG
uniref:Uncharacterized protein n=1 Tax=Triticum urartu TaxID=4572 RepID=A0A8R7U4A6_TRIUA